MTRILLADDSPHAQRMGERILREEGFEVVTVTDGQTALMRLADVDPDVVFADVSLPRKSGYDICREIKHRPRHNHVRVILTAGLLETFDEKEATVVQCDGILKKPFEASLVIEMLKPLIESAQKDKSRIWSRSCFSELGSRQRKSSHGPESTRSTRSAARRRCRACSRRCHLSA